MFAMMLLIDLPKIIVSCIHLGKIIRVEVCFVQTCTVKIIVLILGKFVRQISNAYKWIKYYKQLHRHFVIFECIDAFLSTCTFNYRCKHFVNYYCMVLMQGFRRGFVNSPYSNFFPDLINGGQLFGSLVLIHYDNVYFTHQFFPGMLIIIVTNPLRTFLLEVFSSVDIITLSQF